MPDAHLTHLLEQAEALVRDFLIETAPMVAAYHTALIQAGTPPADALALALDTQRQLFAEFIDAELGAD